MSTLKQFHRQAKSRRQGKPAFTLLELIVVLLVLGILAAISVPTFNRVKENSVQRVAQTTLEAAARNGEAIARSNGDASDEQIAEAVEAEFADENGLTVTVSGKTVTVTQSRGSLTASGSVEFNNGVPTVTDATVSGGGGGDGGKDGGSSSTTSTTVAPAAYSSITLLPESTPNFSSYWYLRGGISGPALETPTFVSYTNATKTLVLDSALACQPDMMFLIQDGSSPEGWVSFFTPTDGTFDEVTGTTTPSGCTYEVDFDHIETTRGSSWTTDTIWLGLAGSGYQRATYLFELS